MEEIKGYCKDCLWLKKEWTVQQDGNQLCKVEDWMCSLCDIFKSTLGYCDMWRLK